MRSLGVEARWVGIAALLLAPLVLALLNPTLGERSELQLVQGELGIVEQSARWIQFILDEQPPPIRYSSRLGRKEVLVAALLSSEGDIACLVDAQHYAWEIAIDGELFMSFEYAKARRTGDRLIGRFLSAVLAVSGLLLLWYSQRLVGRRSA